ncbi:MAG: hypothetical protein KF746_00210 [Chitinophagaceae bacterium]|nr:hypothetical protein [Chitinophagaceae bacterium]
MKRIFAILIFSVHFFNLVGYAIMFHCLQQNNTRQVLQHIERKNYSDEELVLVKIPVLLPYSTNWNEYERFDGEVEWGGIHYNYIKRKILNDTLHLLCLPNIERTRLLDARDRYAGQLNDFNTSPQKNKQSTVKVQSLTGEYIQSFTAYISYTPEITMDNAFSDFSAPLIHTCSDCIIQPPDAVAV